MTLTPHLTPQKEKAILDYLSGQLLLTGSEDMSVMMRGIHMLARTTSKDEMLEGWKIFQAAMPKMRPSKHSCEKFIAYFESIWLSPKYIGSWPDWGRAVHPFSITTNDGIEKWWQEYKKVAAMDRILKRFDELVRLAVVWPFVFLYCRKKATDDNCVLQIIRIGGYGPYGLTPIPSVMDMAALDARDQDTPGYKPRISTDVRR